MLLRFQVAKYAISKQGIKQLETYLWFSFLFVFYESSQGQAHSSQRKSQASSS